MISERYLQWVGFFPRCGQRHDLNTADREKPYTAIIRDEYLGKYNTSADPVMECYHSIKEIRADFE